MSAPPHVPPFLLGQQGAEPPWVDNNPIIRATEHVVEHWPEYLDVLQSPAPYAGAAALAGSGFAAWLLGRRAARYLSKRPGDVVLGRRMQKRGDALFYRPVVLRWPDRTHHMEACGHTGSGKTTALVPIAAQDLMHGHSVLTQEIYGNFGASIIPYAIAMGRPFLIFDPSVEGSLCWNPLAGEDDEEVVEAFASTVEGLIRSHDYYGPLTGDIARGFARLAREYARASAGGEADLALFSLLLNDRAFLNRVLNVQLQGEGWAQVRTVGARWASRKTRSWFESKFLRWNEDMQVRNLSALSTWVEKLLGTRASRRALCPRPGDLTLDLETVLATPGVLVVIRTPVEAMNEEPARGLARFFTRKVQDLTLKRRSSYWPVPPLSMILDEFPTLVGRGRGDAESTAQWMALVRKQNVAVIAAHQGTALIEDVLQGALDTNAMSRLFAGGLWGDDLSRAQDATGYEEREVHDERVTRSAPLSPVASSHSRGTRTQRRPRFGDDELRYAQLGDWVFVPYRDRRQQPAERIRLRPAKPPETYSRAA